MIKMLFFANDNCKNCEKVLRSFRKNGILDLCTFKYIDALEEDTQELCDEHNVDELPHIKIYKDDRLIYEKVGDCNVEIIKEKIEVPKKKNVFKLM